jgi:C4-type Zn-finger protein
MNINKYTIGMKSEDVVQIFIYKSKSGKIYIHSIEATL